MSNLMSARQRAFSSPFGDKVLVQPATTLLNKDGGLLTGPAGVEHVDMAELGILMGIAGGDRGFHAAADIVTATPDGMDVNELWNSYQRWLDGWNGARETLVNFFTYNITTSFENVWQGGSQADFEEATEFGEPVGARPTSTPSVMGFPFKFYDLAGRFTWQFLANTPAAQVDSFANMAMEADSRLMFLKVMKTLFSNTRGLNKEGQTVFPFYSGVAGDLPPTYKMTTFADNHNHFVTSGNAAVTPANVDALVGLLEEHGYTAGNGYNQVILVAKQQGDVIRTFRAVQNGGTARYDFVPAAGTPSFLLPANMVTNGGQPPNSLNGLTVIGAYGDATIIQEDYIPAGYMVAMVTGGAESLSNPLAFREHPTATLRGLRLVKGRTPDYPLIDSFYLRGFGVGVRHRGAGAVMQITAGAYTIPAQYA